MMKICVNFEKESQTSAQIEFSQIGLWWNLQMQKVKANGHDMRPLTESTQMPFDLAFSNSDGNYTPAGTERGIS